MRERIAAAIDQAPRGARGRAAGAPLNLLLLGYSGAGNIGADIRVLETVRQVRAVLGDVQMRATVIGSHVPPDGFNGVAPLPLSSDLAGFLSGAVADYDGVIVTEGSLFTSTFSDTLAAALAGGLGIFSAAGRLSVGYGSEAGAMSDGVAAFASRYCRDSLVLCRNEASRAIVARLHLRAEPGTDTAWTYTPARPDAGISLLTERGWDGAAPVCIVCPVNPFWWPVRPDARRYQEMRERDEHKDLHYLSFFFHHDSEEARTRYRTYVEGLAKAIDVLVREDRVFPLLVGMEPLDRRACADVAARCATPPQIVCADAPADDVVGALRNADLLISSRFHAIVTSMAAQPVTIGVSMDGRITNLLTDAGRPDLIVRADSSGLADEALTAVRAAVRDGDAVRAALGRHVAREILTLGRMAHALAAETERVYPGSVANKIAPDALPPLAPSLHDLLEQHA